MTIYKSQDFSVSGASETVGDASSASVGIPGDDGHPGEDAQVGPVGVLPHQIPGLVAANVNELATTVLTSPPTGTIVFWDGSGWSMMSSGPVSPGSILYWNGSKWSVLEGDTAGVLTSDGAGTLSWVGV